jgi:hypothetical protein
VRSAEQLPPEAVPQVARCPPHISALSRFQFRRIDRMAGSVPPGTCALPDVRTAMSVDALPDPWEARQVREEALVAPG